MRILMVTTSMTTGGIQSVVRDLSEQLVACGHTVGIISLCGKDQVATAPEVLRWSFGFERLAGNIWEALRRLRHVVNEFDPDVVHSHAFHANFVGHLATRCNRQLPCIRTIHSVREGGAFHRFILKGMEVSGGPSVAVSRAVAVAHRLSDRSAIHYNAIDLERFAFSASGRVRIRRQLALRPEDLLALSVGRLTAAKNFQMLVAAAASVLGDFPTLYLAIVGDGSLRQELEAQIEASGYASRILLLGARPDVPALLSAADIYVQSSAWEGFPLAPLEAMASGLQVVATDVGGIGELRPGPVRLVKSGDVVGMAQALQEARRHVRSDSERRNSCSSLSHYSLATWVQGWVEEYQRAMRK